MPQNKVLFVNGLEEIQAVIDSNSKVLVEFGAEWCVPCKKFFPHFEKFAEDRPEVVCVKVDIDVDPLVVSTYAIQSVPTVKYYRRGYHPLDISARTAPLLKREVY